MTADCPSAPGQFAHSPPRRESSRPRSRPPRGTPPASRTSRAPSPPSPKRSTSSVWTCGGTCRTTWTGFDALRWYDTQGAAGSWRAGNLSAGEPVFAPVPGDPSEDHGYWMTYATDRTDGMSQLLVFAAREPEAGPVARVRMPARVPLGLHGCWLPTEE
ncbi:carotenoid oxygenase family protein [Streptomyces mirabilis]|uniref:carotenoid oxygenase family protein n=1 Tax=Streptomyces mirabilis TaxID=68239 RepID=UPI0036E84DCD